MGISTCPVCMMSSLSILSLELIGDATHVTKLFVFWKILGHDPTAVNAGSEPEWKFYDSNRSLRDIGGIQDDNVCEHCVPSVCNRDHVSIRLWCCGRRNNYTLAFGHLLTGSLGRGLTIFRSWNKSYLMKGSRGSSRPVFVATILYRASGNRIVHASCGGLVGIWIMHGQEDL